MKTLITALLLSAAAHAAPTTYTCKIAQVRSAAVTNQTFTSNLLVQTKDCTPLDRAGLSGAALGAPASAERVLNQTLRDGTKIAITTADEVAYGGTITALNGEPVGALDSVESAQFYVISDSESGEPAAALARRLLDQHRIARTPRVDQRRGKSLKTWTRQLDLTIGKTLYLSVEESGPRLGYGGTRPASSMIRVDYLKASREDIGQTFNLPNSRLIIAFLGLRRPVTVSGMRAATNHDARATFTRSTYGLVTLQLDEDLKKAP